MDVDHSLDQSWTRPDDHGYVAVSIEGDAAVITVTGELDIGRYQTLCDSADAIAPLVSRLIIDMGEISFMDSSGLRAILNIQVSALANATHLVLRSPTPQVLRLLDVTGTRNSFVLT